MGEIVENGRNLSLFFASNWWCDAHSKSKRKWRHQIWERNKRSLECNRLML